MSVKLIFLSWSNLIFSLGRWRIAVYPGFLYFWTQKTKYWANSSLPAKDSYFGTGVVVVIVVVVIVVIVIAVV